ncbi:MAG: 16S rRNA (guanine(527)-N(7))-methyltransferase RsmG [Acholeplasmataceae bacterium]|nr:16S rRNA (guanine(527)-N(7))-methyltransferase RsmG [Acholeplasmataceae bacterium]
MENKFKKHLVENLGLEIAENQLKQFVLYFDFLIEYNQSVNLTSITEKEEVFYKHFYDSLTIVKSVDLNQIKSLCDLGAGAGFPSIPIKIIYPHLDIFIIDSLGKRITFLKKLTSILSLSNVQLFNDRIEKHASKHREQYDLVTARALGKLPLIMELGFPLLKVGGQFIAYKSNQFEKELYDSTNALKLLHGTILKTDHFSLPNHLGERTLIVIEKTRKTNILYPRKFSDIKKRSL